MARIGVLSDSHGLENIETIAQAMRQQGVDNVLHLGDLVYKTQSDITANQSLIADQKRLALVMQENALQYTAQWTDAQLASLRQKADHARDISDANATSIYQQVNNYFVQAGIPLDLVLGGNWDRAKPMESVFGNRYLNAQKKDIAGMNIVGLSGGGSQHPLAVREGLLADDPYLERNEVEKWAQRNSPLLEDHIDILATHIPPTDGVHKKMETAVERLKGLLQHRTASGLAKPKVILSGHRHKPAIEFNDELDTLWIQPGTSAFHHNDGPYGTFVILNTDDATKEVKTVEEFRVYNHADGRQEVEHHATRTIDYQQKKIGLTPINKVVFNGQRDSSSYPIADPLAAVRFKTDYHSLKTIQDKEATLAHNLILLDSLAKDDGEHLKALIASARREYLCGRSLDAPLPHADLEALADTIFTAIVADAAQKLHLQPQQGNDLAHAVWVKTWYGISREDIQEALYFGKEITPASIPYNLGSAMIDKAKKHTAQIYFSYLTEGLTPQEIQAMAELYMPQTLQRKHTAEKQEAFKLWSQAQQQGLLAEADVLATGLYEKKKQTTTEQRPPKELYNLLGLPSFAGHDQTEQVQDLIDQGQLPIFRDQRGDYIIGQEKQYLPPQEAQKLHYTPRSLEEALQSGDARILDVNGRHLFRTKNGGFMPFDYAAAGLDPQQYPATPVTMPQRSPYEPTATEGNDSVLTN